MGRREVTRASEGHLMLICATETVARRPISGGLRLPQGRSRGHYPGGETDTTRTRQDRQTDIPKDNGGKIDEFKDTDGQTDEGKNTDGHTSGRTRTGQADGD